MSFFDRLFSFLHKPQQPAARPNTPAARDGLDKTIQHTIDGSCTPGLFPLVSVPTLIGCVGAALILIAAIATPIAKSQGLREVWFYLASAGVMLKILTVEISRLLIH